VPAPRSLAEWFDATGVASRQDLRNRTHTVAGALRQGSI
jgi:hypothetical protein